MPKRLKLGKIVHNCLRDRDFDQTMDQKVKAVTKKYHQNKNQRKNLSVILLRPNILGVYVLIPIVKWFHVSHSKDGTDQNDSGHNLLNALVNAKLNHNY